MLFSDTADGEAFRALQESIDVIENFKAWHDTDGQNYALDAAIEEIATQQGYLLDGFKSDHPGGEVDMQVNVLLTD